MSSSVGCVCEHLHLLVPRLFTHSGCLISSNSSEQDSDTDSSLDDDAESLPRSALRDEAVTGGMRLS